MSGETVYLPLPVVRREVLSVEEALLERRSVRSFQDEPVSIELFSQMLWATYGVTYPRRGFKTAPSAGATFPLDIYVVVRERGVLNSDGSFLEPAVYLYDWRIHGLNVVKKGDYSRELMRACLDQAFIAEASFNIVLVAVYDRTTRYYGERGYRYVYLDAGHVGQNIYLEATALGLGTVAVGAFNDEEVAEVISIHGKGHPIYIFPVGKPSQKPKTTIKEIHEYVMKNREQINKQQTKQ